MAFETQGKNLMAVCNACGRQKKLDNNSKAGKQIQKELPNFYANNPEFRGKRGPEIKVDEQTTAKKAGKKKSKKTAEQDVEVAKQEEQKLKEKKADEILAAGTEVNLLDTNKIDFDSPDMSKYPVSVASTMIKQLVTTFLKCSAFMRQSTAWFCNSDFLSFGALSLLTRL